MFRDVPIQSAIVCGCKLRDIDTGYTLSFPWYIQLAVRGLRHGESTRYQEELVVWAYSSLELLSQAFSLLMSRKAIAIPLRIRVLGNDTD